MVGGWVRSRFYGYSRPAQKFLFAVLNFSPPREFGEVGDSWSPLVASENRISKGGKPWVETLRSLCSLLAVVTVADYRSKDLS